MLKNARIRAVIREQFHRLNRCISKRVNLCIFGTDFRQGGSVIEQYTNIFCLSALKQFSTLCNTLSLSLSSFLLQEMSLTDSATRSLHELHEITFLDFKYKTVLRLTTVNW